MSLQDGTRTFREGFNLQGPGGTLKIGLDAGVSLDPITGIPTVGAPQTVTLTASATNYVEIVPGATTASANTVGFTPGSLPLYVIVAGTKTFTNEYDLRGSSNPPKGLRAFNTQTGTAYTVALTDQGKVVEMNNASANVVTIPLNATVAFPIGTEITVAQLGAGTTSVAIAGGGTLIGTMTLVVARLIKRATDTWYCT